MLYEILLALEVAAVLSGALTTITGLALGLSRSRIKWGPYTWKYIWYLSIYPSIYLSIFLSIYLSKFIVQNFIWFTLHNLSFRNELEKNKTEVSKELWQIKIKNYTPEITWIIIKKCLPYNYSSRKCYLCQNEKLEIALYERVNLLNKKVELISKCRHQDRFMLLRHDSKDWKLRHL